MSDTHDSETQERMARSRATDERAPENAPAIEAPDMLSLASARGVAADPALSERPNASVRASTMQQMQRTYGNRSVQRFLNTAATPAQGSFSVPVQRQVAVQRQDEEELQVPVGDSTNFLLSPTESQLRFGGSRLNLGLGYEFGEGNMFAGVGGQTGGGTDWRARLGLNPSSSELSGSFNLGNFEGRGGYNFQEGSGSGGFTYSPGNFPAISGDLSIGRGGSFGASLGLGNPYIPMGGPFDSMVPGELSPLRDPMEAAAGAGSPGGALRAGAGLIPGISEARGDSRFGAGLFLNRGEEGAMVGGGYLNYRF